MQLRLSKTSHWRNTPPGGSAGRRATSRTPPRPRSCARRWPGRASASCRCSCWAAGPTCWCATPGFAGLVLRYRAQELRVEPQGDAGRAWIAAGAPMAGTVRRLAAQGWGGLQWAEGLPGTIGGAVFGNAGCYGGDVASVLARAWLLIGDAIEEWPVERFAYGYRTSALKTTDDQTTDDRRPDADSATSDRPSSSRSSVGPIVVAAEFDVQRADPRELADADGAHRRRAQGQDALGIVLRQRVQEPAARERRAADRGGWAERARASAARRSRRSTPTTSSTLAARAATMCCG